VAARSRYSGKATVQFFSVIFGRVQQRWSMLNRLAEPRQAKRHRCHQLNGGQGLASAAVAGKVGYNPVWDQVLHNPIAGWDRLVLPIARIKDRQRVACQFGFQKRSPSHCSAPISS
jgi:hypothetical protein